MRIAAAACILACTLFCMAGEEAWIEVKSPNFTIISNDSIHQARRVAKKFEQFRIVFQTAIPKLKIDPGSPLIVVAVSDTRSLEALMPNDRAGKDSAQMAGLFLASPDRNFVLLRADASSDQDYHVIYHEYVHMIMRLNFPSLPIWLNEGLAELFGHATIADGLSGLGRVRAEDLEILKRSWIPLDTLITITRDSPYYHHRNKSAIFYTQSWMLAHYMLLGDPQASKQLNELLGLIQSDVPEKEAFEQSFGDLKELEKKVQRYIRSERFDYFPVETRLRVKEGQYVARTLSEAESLAYRGEVLVHTNRLDDSRVMLEQALRLDPRSAQANEAMGFLFMRMQDQDRANKYFLAAAELDSKRYLAQYYAASSIYSQSGNSGIAESYLRKTLEINSGFAPAYDLLSYILMMEGTKLPEALQFAKQAAVLQPSELRHRINIGNILAKMGKYDEASALGEHLLPIARTEAERSSIDSLLQYTKSRQEIELEAKKRADTLQEEHKTIEEQSRRDREFEEILRTD
jgi:tetratricopeptide (TPR) repeat protein